jgi:hypothetical protein
MSKTNKTLNKCDELIERLEQLKKALGGTKQIQSARTPTPAMGAGWSQDSGTGAFHHSTHGIISTSPHPKGGFQIKHGGGLVGHVKNIGEAGAKIKNYVGSLGATSNGMHNRTSPQVQSATNKFGVKNVTQKGEDGELDKSNYGPKGSNLYNSVDNAKRKMNNTGDQTGVGGNVNTKSFSSKPGQLSAKQQAAKTPYKGAAGPVKQYSPEQIAAINEARKLKKNSEELPWVQHAGVPNADREVEKVQRENPVAPGEEVMAEGLRKMMMSKSMLNPNHRQPSSEDMIMHAENNRRGQIQELEKQEQNWGGAINNWLVEAQKPISARFSSPEEEAQYWDSIRVNGSGRKDDDYGF